MGNGVDDGVHAVCFCGSASHMQGLTPGEEQRLLRASRKLEKLTNPRMIRRRLRQLLTPAERAKILRLHQSQLVELAKKVHP